MSVSEGFQFEERVREGSAEGFRVREVPLDPNPNPNPPPTLNSIELAQGTSIKID